LFDRLGERIEQVVVGEEGAGVDSLREGDFWSDSGGGVEGS